MFVFRDICIHNIYAYTQICIYDIYVCIYCNNNNGKRGHAKQF